MDPKIEKAIAEERRAARKRMRAVAAVQAACTHNEILECPWEELHYGNLRPLRVCVNCGLTEQGWGSGYHVLTAEAKPVDRDTVYRTRQGLVIRQDDEQKLALMRGETTVAGLVGKWLEESLKQ